MLKNTVSLILVSLFFVFPDMLHAHSNPSKKNKFDLFLKTTDSWKMVNKQISVPQDFPFHDSGNLPGKYFHGALLTEQLEGREPGPVVFHVNFPSQGEFVFYLETVSDTGIVRVTLDKKILKTFTFLTGPEGRGPWTASRRAGEVFQCDYNTEYRLKIPAGRHNITVQNMGTDWLSIGYFVFTKYSRNILNPKYEEWKEYKTTLHHINERKDAYKEKALKISSLQPDQKNYNIIPTLMLQLENFERLAKSHVSVDFNLTRTEKELKELFEYVGSDKDYFKLKRGRIKVGYLSTIDSTYQPYDILIPQQYDSSRKYALVLSLHGYQNELQKYSNFIGENNNPIPDSLHIITASVYGRRNHFYLGAAETDVLTVMKKVQEDYSIDPDKIYLTGSSMGGFGTWHIGLSYPSLFAAISPICAPSIFSGSRFLNALNPIEYILNARNLPVRIYHGAADSTVHVSNSRKMAARLNDLHYTHVYMEYPGVGHDTWNNADADTNRYPWLLQFKRNPYPLHVVHKAFFLCRGTAYWLQITGKAQYNIPSVIEGSVAGESEIRIQTENISSFSLDLKHPGINPKKPIEIIIDEDSTLLSTFGEHAEFYKSGEHGWVVGTPPKKGLSKNQTMEGPFAAGEMKPFLLVYGTGNAKRINFLKKIGSLLQKYYSASDMEIQLLPDTLARAGSLEKTNNLYLIGSPDENIYFKEILPGLPVFFTKDSMEFNGIYNRMETGFRMIYPNPKNQNTYVLLDKYPEFMTDTDRLINFPAADYFIYSFKDGKFEVLKDEYFDSEWRITR